LEYIPYDQFTNVKTHVDDNGFAIIHSSSATIYKATWLNGERRVENNSKARSNPTEVILKKVRTREPVREILLEVCTSRKTLFFPYIYIYTHAKYFIVADVS